MSASNDVNLQVAVAEHFFTSVQMKPLLEIVEKDKEKKYLLLSWRVETHIFIALGGLLNLTCENFMNVEI